MDRNSPDFYIEQDTDRAIADVKTFVNTVEKEPKKASSSSGKGTTTTTTTTTGNLVTPSLIPRFAPSCSARLMRGLGDFRRGELPVHTHLSENEAECDFVGSLFPEADCYVDVYKRAGLLHAKSYFAHCCYCDLQERTLVSKSDAGVITCPTSNFMVGRALCDVRQWLDHGVKVGIGTDVAGGYSTSMFNAIRHVVVASSLVAAQKNDPTKRISWKEALFLATAGSASCLHLKTGAFMKGNFFDALIVDLDAPDSAYDVHPTTQDDTLDWLFEKFIWNGDDRNILHVYVNGIRVAGAAKTKNPNKLGGLAVGAAILTTTVALFTLTILRRRA